MKVIIYVNLVVCIFLFSSCNFKKSIEKVEGATKSVSKKYDCNLSFEFETSGTENNLHINVKSDLKNEFAYGMILKDVHNLLERDHVEVSNYRISQSGQKLFEISNEDWDLLKKKKSDLDLMIHFFITSNYKKVYESIDESLISSVGSYEEFSKNFNSLVLRTYKDYDGFILSDFNGKKFITFKVSNGSKYIQISFLFESENPKIHGLEII